jgi:hypothetical protein
LILLIGYFLFAEKWVGTPFDFFTAFLWAYGSDVGAEGVTAAAQGIKKA